MSSPQARRQQVPWVQRRGLSNRRACWWLSVPRSLLGYTPRRLLRDAELVAAMRALAQRHPRDGHRPIWTMWPRQGVRVNHQRVYRLWQAHGMTVHVRHRRKRSGLPSARLPEATRPHEMWADDFVHDRCANGEGLTCLVVVDEDRRLCLAIEVGRRIGCERVIQVLVRLIQRYGVPRDLRSDNGPAFVAHAVKAWLSANGINTVFIEPGKPWQNGAVEVIGRFRDECLNMEWVLSRREARVIIGLCCKNS